MEMGSNETNEEQELLARLQSQFGDLDVGGMLLLSPLGRSNPSPQTVGRRVMESSALLTMKRSSPTAIKQRE